MCKVLRVPAIETSAAGHLDRDNAMPCNVFGDAIGGVLHCPESEGAMRIVLAINKCLKYVHIVKQTCVLPVGKRYSSTS